jgi:hypothetical protein
VPLAWNTSKGVSIASVGWCGWRANKSKPYPPTHTRINVFELKTLKCHNNWLYPISFPFLPVHRLAIEMMVPTFKSETKKTSSIYVIHDRLILSVKLIMNVIVHLILIVLASSTSDHFFFVLSADSLLVVLLITQFINQIHVSIMANVYRLMNKNLNGSRCKLQATSHVHRVAIYSVLDWWHRHTNIVAFSYIDTSKKTIDKTKNSSSISYTITKHVLQTWHYTTKGFIYKSNFFLIYWIFFKNTKTTEQFLTINCFAHHWYLNSTELLIQPQWTI